MGVQPESKSIMVFFVAFFVFTQNGFKRLNPAKNFGDSLIASNTKKPNGEKGGGKEGGGGMFKDTFKKCPQLNDFFIEG